MLQVILITLVNWDVSVSSEIFALSSSSSPLPTQAGSAFVDSGITGRCETDEDCGKFYESMSFGPQPSKE